MERKNRKYKIQRNILLLFLIILFIIFSFKNCNKENNISINDIIDIYEQNIEALQDSIYIYKTKNKNLLYEKSILIIQKQNLKKYNQKLYNEIKYLKNNPIIITKQEIKIIRDTVYIFPQIDSSNIVFENNILLIPFKWKDSVYYGNKNYRILEGKYIIEIDTNMNIKTKDFIINKDEIGISFITGIAETKDDRVKIFIKSEFPGFKVTSIEGALFDPRNSKIIKKFFPQKRWGLSIYSGYGFYFDIQKMKFGRALQIGIGINYNIIKK